MSNIKSRAEEIQYEKTFFTDEEINSMIQSVPVSGPVDALRERTRIFLTDFNHNLKAGNHKGIIEAFHLFELMISVSETYHGDVPMCLVEIYHKVLDITRMYRLSERAQNAHVIAYVQNTTLNNLANPIITE